MPDDVLPGRLDITVGGLSRADLMRNLASRDIRLNAYAETLLGEAVFDRQPSRVIGVTERTVADLGFATGATLSQIFAASQDQGLLLCPPDTGPYLRMASMSQAATGGPVVSSGRAPGGSLTIAAETLRDDIDFPKGFYLRLADGHAWLRGYRCDDEHEWSPGDRFVFRVEASD